MTENLLEVRDLSVDFKVRHERRWQIVQAVRGVSLDIRSSATFGLVGESGSGKSTLARAVLHLVRPTSGRILLGGEDVSAHDRRSMKLVHASCGMVFQNPVAALDPRMTVFDCIAEPLRQQKVPGPEIERRITEMLGAVGLPGGYRDRLPHQLSGGQCQRVGIARSLVTRPKLLVLDEPTSALDVSVQAQILNLLHDLRAEYELTYLLISHDLDVIRHMSDEVAVMYRGQVVEKSDAASLFERPQHPYTSALLAARPGLGREALRNSRPLDEVLSAAALVPAR
jgi:ABC-type glutathione transport system ATPase component